MMTLKWIDLHCPVCESVFESMAASTACPHCRRLGELWLRIGDTRQANAWFERAGRSS